MTNIRSDIDMVKQKFLFVLFSEAVTVGAIGSAKYYKWVEMSSNVSQCQIRVRFDSGVKNRI